MEWEVTCMEYLDTAFNEQRDIEQCWKKVGEKSNFKGVKFYSKSSNMPNYAMRGSKQESTQDGESCRPKKRRRSKQSADGVRHEFPECTAWSG